MTAVRLNNLLYYLLIISVLNTIALKTDLNKKHLKSLINLDGMSKCSLGYTALYYNLYGCYCGFGGSGTPIDGIDECCMHHDECYIQAELSGFCASDFREYVTVYKWECVKKEAICGENQDDKCKAALCKCDSTLVKCWSKYDRPAIIKPECKSD